LLRESTYGEKEAHMSVVD